jgi:hypothetical protein
MGSSDFMQYQSGASRDEAFREAAESARYEHGAGGYSGTLAEKDSVVTIQQRPLSRPAAEALAGSLLGADDPRINDKWGPAGAIPVIASTRTVEIAIPAGVSSDYGRQEVSPAALEAVKAAKVLRRGERVLRVELFHYTSPRTTRYSHRASQGFTNGTARVVIEKPGGPFERTVGVSVTFDGPLTWNNEKDWAPVVDAKVRRRDGERIIRRRVTHQEPKVKVAAVANTEHKAETRYVIEGSRQHGTWATGFATQAQARAKAVEMAAAEPRETLHVIGITRRAGEGEALVTVHRQVVKTTAVVEVTLVKDPPANADGAPDGWLFFGFASS